MISHKSLLFRRKEILPQHCYQLNSVVKKIFIPNSKKVKSLQTPPPCFEEHLGPRVNPFNIQMLSRKIYEQIFSSSNTQNCDPMILEECRKNLLEHNMMTNKDFMQDVEFKLPPLEGKDIEEHFQNVGNSQVKPYRDLVEALLKGIPKAPDKWVRRQGWTRYVDGCEPEEVPHPLEDAFVFNIKITYRSEEAPTVATAVSNKAWYSWASQSQIDGRSKLVTSQQYSIQQLIPMESSSSDTGIKLTPHMEKPKIIIGHNVPYARSRIKEQYWLNRTGTRFIDTMSLHYSVYGLTNDQLSILESREEDFFAIWKNHRSFNSLPLAQILELHCGKSLPEATSKVIFMAEWSHVKEFQTTMKNCSYETKATYDVLKALFPNFLERFPHPVTLAGMLELSTAYLPINTNWNRCVTNSEDTYDDLDTERQIVLARRADQACQLLHDEKYTEDIWLWDNDWSVKNLKLKGAEPKRRNTKNQKNDQITKEVDKDEDYLDEKFRYLQETRCLLRKDRYLCGYPTWYKELCYRPDSPDWVPGPHRISTSLRITPSLFSLTWEGYPLHYRHSVWGFLGPFTDDLESTPNLPLKQILKKCPLLITKRKEGSTEAWSNVSPFTNDYLMRKEIYWNSKRDTGGLYTGLGIWRATEVENCCFFMDLPHQDGTKWYVCNPLARGFLNKFLKNGLAGHPDTELVLSTYRMLSYWQYNRDRIFNQTLVWLDENNLPNELHGNGMQYGAILPRGLVCGTVTRRAVEPSWMTASNAQEDRVGSELRSMIQAPPGYNLVGADVDSKELWIAAVIGDAHHAKMHGATPFGWMTLNGNKADGTDMHSMTAKAVGISREQAKFLNYARIYGAGQKFAETHLKQFKPLMTDAEATSEATKMFTLTKGKRIFYLKQEFRDDFPDQAYLKCQANEIAKTCGKRVDDMFIKPTWVGGTESASFNRLEAIANNLNSCTPFLNGRQSRRLELKWWQPEDEFLPTRVNWVVQSSAVDFLHLMLVCMRWIMGDKARFCLSFHDEVKYLVPEQYKYQAALAMHVTNLLTRTFCSVRLGVNDLPLSVAFCSTVEVDTVLRKDAKQDCKSPSNPYGLENRYGVKNGESLDVYEAIEKAGGKNCNWYRQLR